MRGYARERYARLRADGYCTRGCGRRAYTGGVYCLMCGAKQRKTKSIAAKRAAEIV